MLERFKKLYHDHEPACTVAFFVAGFLFDTLAVGRIDKLHNIIHQATYLALCAFFTTLELRENRKKNESVYTHDKVCKDRHFCSILQEIKKSTGTLSGRQSEIQII